MCACVHGTLCSRVSATYTPLYLLFHSYRLHTMPWQVVYSGGADGGPDSGAVAVVTMCTSRANQINTAFLDDLDRAVGEVCGHTPPVRGMVLTSTGSVFSSGLDIVHNFNDRAFTRAFIQRYESAMRRVLTLPFPTVAALNGHVSNPG